MNPDELKQKFDEAVQGALSGIRIYTDKNVDYKKIFEDLNDKLVAIAMEAAPAFTPEKPLEFVEEDLGDEEVDEVEVYEDYMVRVDTLTEEELAVAYVRAETTKKAKGTLTPEEDYVVSRWNEAIQLSATLGVLTEEARGKVAWAQPLTTHTR